MVSHRNLAICLVVGRIYCEGQIDWIAPFKVPRCPCIQPSRYPGYSGFSLNFCGAWDSQHCSGTRWSRGCTAPPTSSCLTVPNFDGSLYSCAGSPGSGTSLIRKDAFCQAIPLGSRAFRVICSHLLCNSGLRPWLSSPLLILFA